MYFGARFVRFFNKSYCNNLCVLWDQDRFSFQLFNIAIYSIFRTRFGCLFNYPILHNNLNICGQIGRSFQLFDIAVLSIFRTRFFSISQLIPSDRCSRCEEDDPPPFHTSSMEGLAQTHYSG